MAPKRSWTPQHVLLASWIGVSTFLGLITVVTGDDDAAVVQAAQRSASTTTTVASDPGDAPEVDPTDQAESDGAADTTTTAPPDATTTVPPTNGADLDTTDDGADGATGGSGGSGGTTSGGANGGGGGGGSSNTSTPRPIVQPAPGTYPSTAKGSISPRLVTIPPNPPFIVESVGGSDQRVRIETGIASMQMVLRYHADSAELLELALSTGGSPTRYRAQSPAPWLPANASSGATYRWDLSGSGGSITGNGEVAGREAVAVGGRSVNATKMVVQLHIEGSSFKADGPLTVWIDPDDRLPVRTHVNLKGSFSGIGFQVDVDSTLTSTTPS